MCTRNQNPTDKQRLMDLQHGDGQEAIDGGQPYRQRKADVLTESQQDEKMCRSSQPSENDNREGQTADMKGCPDRQEGKYRQTDRQ